MMWTFHAFPMGTFLNSVLVLAHEQNIGNKGKKMLPIYLFTLVPVT